MSFRDIFDETRRKIGGAIGNQVDNFRVGLNQNTLPSKIVKGAGEYLAGGAKRFGTSIGEAAYSPIYARQQKLAGQRALVEQRALENKLRTATSPIAKQRLQGAMKGYQTDFYNPQRDLGVLNKSNIRILGEAGQTAVDTLGVGGLKGLKGIQIAKPTTKLLVNTLGRGAEGAGYGALDALSRGGNKEDIIRSAKMGGAFGGVLGFASGAPLKALKYQKIASSMDSPIPSRYSELQGAKLYKPNVKTVVQDIKDFAVKELGFNPKVNHYQMKGKVTKVLDPDTGKLISWSTDNPNFARNVQEGKLTMGMSTRSVKPSEDALSNEAKNFGNITNTSNGKFVAYDTVRNERLYKPNSKNADIQYFDTQQEARNALDKVFKEKYASKNTPNSPLNTPSTPSSALSNEAKKIETSLFGTPINQEKKALLKSDYEKGRNYQFKYKVGDRVKTSNGNEIVRDMYIQDGQPRYTTYPAGKKTSYGHHTWSYEKDLQPVGSSATKTKSPQQIAQEFPEFGTFEGSYAISKKVSNIQKGLEVTDLRPTRVSGTNNLVEVNHNGIVGQGQGLAGAIDDLSSKIANKKMGVVPKTPEELARIQREATVGDITRENPLSPQSTQGAKIPLKPDSLSNEARTITPRTIPEPSLPQSTEATEKIRIPKQQSKPSEKFSLIGEIKRKLVDSTAPLSDTLSIAEKEGKFNVLPKNDIRLQIDRVLRSDSLATQFIKDNKLDEVIRKVDDLDEFNQYLIAKQSRDVSSKGITTGRDSVADDNLIAALSEKYEPFAQQIYAYNRKLLDTLTESGMISKELNAKLKAEYPNYVPLNRVFSEIEQKNMGFTGRGKGVASQGTQGTVRKLKGSEREIEDPIESIIAKTSQAFQEAERNKAAQMLASYKDLPGNPFGLEEIKGAKAAGDSTISVWKDGKKVIYKADPVIAEAAKNLNQQQIGILGQIIAVPTRILKLGATGVNLPFVASNIVKDQAFATINSNRALQTSLANPVNFVRSFWTALTGKGQLYDDWVRSGSSFTSFDIARNQVKPTVARIRSGRSVGGRIAYSITHPQELVRAVEDIIGKSEELTRIQQFNGMKNQLIKEGRTVEDATLLAAKASRENTANFARRGEWGNWLNVLIPYLNAGIQGTRSLVGNMTKRPVQTAAKLSTIVFLPMAYATTWNLSDPKRREAYEDIQDYEKENNIIIIPPNPQKDENGRWNAIKIPLTPGVSNLASIIRRGVEGVAGLDGNSFTQVASDLFAAGTSFELNKNKLVSQLTTQGLKPIIEGYTNTNLFTGNKIVPDYMKDLPPELQARDNTSGTARIAGKLLNTSPLKVENAIRTIAGGVGQQALNASDRLLARTGAIPEDQIGGKDVGEAIANRFTSASGGQQLNNLYDNKQTKSKSKTESDYDNPNNYKIVESNDKVYISFGKNKVKTFEDTKEAQEFLDKDTFNKSGKKSELKDGTYFYRKADGDIGTYTEQEYNYKLRNAKMDIAYNKKDYKGWVQLANEKLKDIEKQYNEADPLTQQELLNDYQDLAAKIAKYSGYGGFTKGKSGGSGSKFTGITLPTTTAKIPIRQAKAPAFKNISKTPRIAIKTNKPKMISKSTLANMR